jgi:hypothetical protein
VHVILAHAATTGAKLISADVSNAFLHAPLRNEVYAKVPAMLSMALGIPGFVKLHKSIYGLVQSAALWQKRLNEPLTDVLPRANAQDECMRSRTVECQVDLLGTHVDDMLGVDSSGSLLADLQEAMDDAKLPCTFEVDPVAFRGATIQRDEHGIYMSQEKSIRELAEHVNATAKLKARPQGPWKVLEYGSKDHNIIPGTTRTRARNAEAFGALFGLENDTATIARAARGVRGRVRPLRIPGSPTGYAMFARVKGSKAKKTWSRSLAKRTPAAMRVFKSSHQRSLLRALSR